MDAIATNYYALWNAGWKPVAHITIVAGENGSGKSSLLRTIAQNTLKARRSVLALSGTSHDKFRGLRLGSALLSPMQKSSQPEQVMKRTISHFVEKDSVQLRVVSRVLRHCGYAPTVGIEVLMPSERKAIPSSILSDFEAKMAGEGENILALILMLQSKRWDQIQWMDFDDYRFDHSVNSNLVGIVRWEHILKKLGVITGIRLHLQGKRGILRLDKASSGELTLITMLSFVAAMSKEKDIILIDEPENSLHPRWQREYLELLMGSVGYSEAKIVIASHSPILVMAASELNINVQTLVLSDVFNSQIELNAAGLEEVMAEVFHTYTPRNHYLSKTLVRLMDRVEKGDLTAAQATSQIAEIERSGVDSRQSGALAAVSAIVEKMEEIK
ncbi:ATP-binding protein [Stenotrophomonas sp. RG-453]|uniref:ATP-binding protein n=1 Tax=Stenotrophomonas sp. RG-453 TaxID=2957502 RepID=UPI0029CA6AFB|nr:ATP-binding protein [Stenotrophomonas sp. RG-453]MDX5516513.1 ATP-binding protein [Stenotrophomonas sp. RG-453]